MWYVPLFDELSLINIVRYQSLKLLERCALSDVGKDKSVSTSLTLTDIWYWLGCLRRRLKFFIPLDENSLRLQRLFFPTLGPDGFPIYDIYSLENNHLNLRSASKQAPYPPP